MLQAVSSRRVLTEAARGLRPVVAELEEPAVVAAPCHEAVLKGCRVALERIGTITRTIGVTSAVRGEGRTTVARGLATVTVVDHDIPTLLVDLDLANGTLAERLGVRRGPGVAEILGGGAGIHECVQRLDTGLWVLPAGEVGDGASRLASRLGGDLLTRLGSWGDTVIADLPPLLEGAAGLAATRLFETLVLVTRAGVTPVPRVREAVGLLPSPPHAILNGARTSLPRWLRRATGDWS